MKSHGAPLRRQTRTRLRWPADSTRWSSFDEVAAIYEKPDEPKPAKRRGRKVVDIAALAAEYEL
jgi:hypothetical protein